MTASLLPAAKQQFLDAAGNPLAFGTVDFFVPGTTTRKTTWQDAAQTIFNTNPVDLDAAGEAVVYGSGAYRQVVKDSLGNLVWDQPTQDPVALVSGLSWAGTAAGTANALALAADGSVAAYTAGQSLAFLPALANTGPATLNVNGLGARPLTQGTAALTGGELQPGVAVGVRYDGTRFQMAAAPVIPAGSAAAPGLPVRGSPGTGLFSPAADTLGVSAGGAEVARFAASLATLGTPVQVGAQVAGVGPALTAGPDGVVASHDAARAIAGTFGTDTARFGSSSPHPVVLVQNGNPLLNLLAGNELGYNKATDDGTYGWYSYPTGRTNYSTNADASLSLRRWNSDGSAVLFGRDNSQVGSIAVTTTATAYNTGSDRRIKDDVQDLGDVGAVVDALRPRTWRWRLDPSKPRGVGFVAQELHEHAPQAVTPGDADPDLHPGDDGFEQWGVDYAQLTPLLVAEVQALRKRVAALEAAGG